MHAVPNVHFIYVQQLSLQYLHRKEVLYIYLYSIIISLNLRKEQQEQKSKEQ